jgi:hypothetical protein
MDDELKARLQVAGWAAVAAVFASLAWSAWQRMGE